MYVLVLFFCWWQSLYKFRSKNGIDCLNTVDLITVLFVSVIFMMFMEGWHLSKTHFKNENCILFKVFVKVYMIGPNSGSLFYKKC